MNLAYIIAAIIFCGCIGYFVFTKIHDAFKIRCNSDGTVPAERFEIEYDLKKEYRIKGTPAERTEPYSCTYRKHLQSITKQFPFCPEFMFTLARQDEAMASLYDGLTVAIRRTGLKDVFDLEEIINPVFASYRHNCDITINVIREAWRNVDDNDDPFKVRSDIFNGIVDENFHIIESLVELRDSIRTYNARNNEESPERLSRAAATSKLDQLTAAIKAVAGSDNDSTSATEIEACASTLAYAGQT